jgi:signal recognition particle receptor subunit beta
LKFLGGQIYLKVVFFGTALAGKTSILEWLFRNAVPDELKVVREVMNLKTSFGQTLLFDFVPIRLSQDAVALFYTCTGQDYYRGTRDQVLEGADVIFLVVDSQKKEIDHNREIVEELRHYLSELKSLADTEVIVLFNKQDMADIYPPPYLAEKLGLGCWPGVITSAATGENLQESLVLMLTIMASKLEKQGLDVL